MFTTTCAQALILASRKAIPLQYSASSRHPNIQNLATVYDMKSSTVCRYLELAELRAMRPPSSCGAPLYEHPVICTKHDIGVNLDHNELSP